MDIKTRHMCVFVCVCMCDIYIYIYHTHRHTHPSSPQETHSTSRDIETGDRKKYSMQMEIKRKLE